jgi:hypothetical protein
MAPLDESKLLAAAEKGDTKAVEKLLKARVSTKACDNVRRPAP